MGRTANYIYFFLLLIVRSAYLPAQDACDSYDALTQQALHIWTAIDLVRAVNITHEQKEYFLGGIREQLLELLELYKKNYNYVTRTEAKENSFAELMHDIKKNYCEVFCDSSLVIFMVTVLLFNQLLKAPIDSKTE